MFIDSESSEFLDCLISGRPDYGRGVFSYDYLSELLGMADDDVIRICKALAKQGLVEFARYSTGADMGVALTQKGKTYKELQRLETKERWKERLYGFVSGVLITVLGGIIGKLL